MSSANRKISDSIPSGRSFMYSTNGIGPNTLTCGIPLVTLLHFDGAPFIISFCFLFSRKFSIHFTVYSSMPYDLILCINLLYGTWSKAFIKSMYTAFILYPCSTEDVQSSIIFKSCTVIDRLSMKPYCCLLNGLFFPIWLIISLLFLTFVVSPLYCRLC